MQSVGARFGGHIDGWIENITRVKRANDPRSDGLSVAIAILAPIGIEDRWAWAPKAGPLNGPT